MTDINNVTDYYYILIKDVRGKQRFVITDFISISFRKERYGTFNFVITLDNSKYPDVLSAMKTGLDWRIEIRRSVPGCGLGWYKEFEGFYRTYEIDYSRTKTGDLSIVGVGLNDLLRRKVVGYRAGTTGADKDAEALTVMREYVLQNCGLGATYSGGLNREAGNGIILGLSVDQSYVSKREGNVWSGSKEGETIIDALRSIAEERKTDFGVFSTETTSYDLFSILNLIKLDGGPDYTQFFVVGDEPGGFIFKCQDYYIGLDRSDTQDEINPFSGRNKSGNIPVIFSPQRGNIAAWRYKNDRSSEISRVLVFGQGDSLIRDWIFIDGDNVLDSPYNVCEAVKSGSDQEYQFQLRQTANDELAKAQPNMEITFEPTQKPNCLYGKHYEFGDLVTFRTQTESDHFIITGVDCSVQGGATNLTFTLERFVP